jgi:hypothetical protein
MWRVCAMGTFARKLRDRERGARDGADATLSTSATRSRAARVRIRFVCREVDPVVLVRFASHHPPTLIFLV